MTIILPEGTVDAWQAAHVADTIGTWNDLGEALLLYADPERDRTLRDNLITLALLAAQRALDLLPSLDLAGA